MRTFYAGRILSRFLCRFPYISQKMQLRKPLGFKCGKSLTATSFDMNNFHKSITDICKIQIRKYCKGFYTYRILLIYDAQILCHVIDVKYGQIGMLKMENKMVVLNDYSQVLPERLMPILTTIINHLFRRRNYEDKSAMTEARQAFYKLLIQLLREQQLAWNKEFASAKYTDTNLPDVDGTIGKLLSQLQNEVKGLDRFRPINPLKPLTSAVGKTKTGKPHNLVWVIEQTLSDYSQTFADFYAEKSTEQVPENPLDLITNSDYADLNKRIPDGSIDMVLTDPPYFINAAVWDKQRSEAERKEFFLKYVKSLADVVSDNCILAIFNDEQNVGIIQECIREVSKDTDYPNFNFSIVDVLEWLKSNPVSKGVRGSEYLIVAMNTKGSPYPRDRISSAFEDMREIYLSVAKDSIRDGDGSIHSTTKKAALIQELILRFTISGDFILDNFSGSGTISQLCWENGRHYLATELDSYMWMKSIVRSRRIRAKIHARPFPSWYRSYTNSVRLNPIMERYDSEIRFKYDEKFEEMPDNQLYPELETAFQKWLLEIERKKGKPTKKANGLGFTYHLADFTPKQVAFILGYYRDVFTRLDGSFLDNSTKSLVLDRIDRMYFSELRPLMINADYVVATVKIRAQALRNYKNKELPNRKALNTSTKSGKHILQEMTAIKGSEHTQPRRWGTGNKLKSVRYYVEYLNQLINDLFVLEEQLRNKENAAPWELRNFYEVLTEAIVFRQILIKKTRGYRYTTREDDRFARNLTTMRQRGFAFVQMFSAELPGGAKDRFWTYFDSDSSSVMLRNFEKEYWKNGTAAFNTLKFKGISMGTKQPVEEMSDWEAFLWYHKQVSVPSMPRAITNSAKDGIILGLQFANKHYFGTPKYREELAPEVVYDRLKIKEYPNVSDQPTFILFKSGKTLSQLTPSQMRKWLRSYIWNRFASLFDQPRLVSEGLIPINKAINNVDAISGDAGGLNADDPVLSFADSLSKRYNIKNAKSSNATFSLNEPLKPSFGDAVKKKDAENNETPRH